MLRVKFFKIGCRLWHLKDHFSATNLYFVTLRSWTTAAKTKKAAIYATISKVLFEFSKKNLRTEQQNGPSLVVKKTKNETIGQKLMKFRVNKDKFFCKQPGFLRILYSKWISNHFRHTQWLGHFYSKRAAIWLLSGGDDKIEFAINLKIFRIFRISKFPGF